MTDGKPFYKHPQVWIIIIIGLITLICSIRGGHNFSIQKPYEEPIEYQEISADILLIDLKENSMVAEHIYGGLSAEITGRLTAIDANGNYFSLSSMNDTTFSLQSILCHSTTDKLSEKINQAQINDIITIRGKIISISDTIGYQVEVFNILN